jgi:secondary thiamine-phosphate synthase enzyme
MKWKVISDRVAVATRGDGQVVDVTRQVAEKVAESGLRDGQALVFVSGSTAGLTTVEYEPGLCRDLPEMFERIAPRGHRYYHEETWHDGNGHSHVQASLLGPSLTVPVERGRLLLGTWQQIVLVDFDARPRRRELVVQLTGFAGEDSA